MSHLPVPFFDYARLYKIDYPVYSNALNDVLLRSDFILRDDLIDFEKNLAKYLEIEHVVGVANGTDAIWLGLMAAGITSGDEVILPSHTYVATADAVKFLGATPVLVDCQEDHLVSPAAIEEAITDRTRAIIPVNLNGRACQLDEIQNIAKKYDLKIVEDNAQGLGAKLEGRSTGSFGESGTMSFFPAKNLGCLGDGGAVTTNSKDIAEKILLLRNHGRNSSGEVVAWGLNSRLDNLQAAILNAKLSHLDESIALRRKIATLYCEGLYDVEQIVLPPKPEESARHFDSYQNFEIEAEDRDELREYLSSKGIGTSLPWGGKAVHHFNLPGVKVKDLSRTEKLFTKILLLPLNQYMHEAEVVQVIEQLRNFYLRRHAE
jgi:dTDP-4-amino-4,6-dideoxygalactose transaminase